MAANSTLLRLRKDSQISLTRQEDGVNVTGTVLMTSNKMVAICVDGVTGIASKDATKIDIPEGGKTYIIVQKIKIKNVLDDAVKALLGVAYQKHGAIKDSFMLSDGTKLICIVRPPKTMKPRKAKSGKK
jgi:hypothetical protein